MFVLTENAVGFENGAERVTADRETDPLHVSVQHGAGGSAYPQQLLQLYLKCVYFFLQQQNTMIA